MKIMSDRKNAFRNKMPKSRILSKNLKLPDKRRLQWDCANAACLQQHVPLRGPGRKQGWKNPKKKDEKISKIGNWRKNIL